MKTELKMKMGKNGIDVNLTGCKCKKKLLIDLIEYSKMLLSHEKKNCYSNIDYIISTEIELTRHLKSIEPMIYNAYVKCITGENGYYFNRNNGYYKIDTCIHEGLDKDKYSSIWYTGSNITVANVNDSKDVTLCIRAEGEVKYILTDVDGEEFILTREKDFALYFKNDMEVEQALNGSHPDYELEILSNNWFEVYIYDCYDNIIDSMVSGHDDIRLVISEAHSLLIMSM